MYIDYQIKAWKRIYVEEEEENANKIIVTVCNLDLNNNPERIHSLLSKLMEEYGVSNVSKPELLDDEQYFILTEDNNYQSTLQIWNENGNCIYEND